MPAVDEIATKNLYKLQQDIIMCKNLYRRHRQELNLYGSVTWKFLNILKRQVDTPLFRVKSDLIYFSLILFQIELRSLEFHP